MNEHDEGWSVLWEEEKEQGTLEDEFRTSMDAKRRNNLTK